MFLDNQFHFTPKRQELFGYEPTYKGLKRAPYALGIEDYKRYEPTYKGLKRFSGGSLSQRRLRYEPTYKGLKQGGRLRSKEASDELRAYL